MSVNLYNQRKVCRKEYYMNNSTKTFQKQKGYYLENRAQLKEYQIKNHDRIITRKKIYFSNSYKTDVSFRLTHITRCRLRQPLNGKSKSISTKEILGIDVYLYKKWIESQLYGEMTLENYGKIWCLDHCLPIASFNLLDQNELKICFNWVNLRPMYVKDNIIKGDKNDMRLYLLQEVKAKYFLRMKEEGLN